METNTETITQESSDFKWYVISTRIGHEKKVAGQLEIRIKTNNLEDKVKQVIVPTQDKIIAKAGKRKNIQEKIYPGYVLVNMVLADDTWHIIRNTEGVNGFVGSTKKPAPLSDLEARAIIALSEVKQTSFETPYTVGQAVKVASGPFKDFIGNIKEINEDKGQLVLVISMFGREVPMPLDFAEVTSI